MTAQRDELEHDYGSGLQDAWENGMGDLNEDSKLDEHGYPVLGEYIFGEHNPSRHRRN